MFCKVCSSMGAVVTVWSGLLIFKALMNIRILWSEKYDTERPFFAVKALMADR